MLLAEIGIDHAEAEKEPEHWSRAAQIYHQIEAPLQPSAEDIATMERFVATAARLRASAFNPKLNAILLGVTPAIATMAWPPNTNLLAIDRSEGMLHGVWPGDRPGIREARLGDWLALPVDDASCSVVVGDGSFNCLEFPTAYQQLANSVARVLHEDGVLIARVYVQPATPSSLEKLWQDLVAGQFSTFDGFKFLLCMGLVDEQFNVAVHDVWQYWSQVKGNEQALFNATGWSAAKFATIAHYQNSAARYSFPTLSEVERIFSAQFKKIDIAFPTYPLGECCPTLMLRKRSRATI